MRTVSPLYRDVLRDAFVYTWKNAYIWPFGLFAGILLSGSAYDLLLRTWNFLISSTVSGKFGYGYPFMLGQTLTQNGHLNIFGVPGWLFVLCIASLIVCVAIIALSVISQGALIDAVVNAEEHKKPNLQTFLVRSKKVFWQILSLNILTRIIAALAIFVIAILLVPGSMHNDRLLTSSAILAFIILIPLAYLAVTMALFAAFELVKSSCTLGNAITRAWKLVVKNWLIVCETAILVTFIDFLAAVVFVVAAMVVFIPFFVLFLISMLFHSTFVFWLLLVLFLITIITFVIAVSAAVVTFHYTVWSILAERLENGQAIAKVIRMFSTIKNAFKSRSS